MAITLHTDAPDLPEQTELAQPHVRDEFQQEVDNHVGTLKMKTAGAQWPDPDPKSLFHRYVVGADDRAALKAIIRRAAVLHRVEPLFYKDAKTEAGHFVIKFHLARKTDKDGKPVKDDTLNDNGTPKTAPAPAPAAAAPAPAAPKPDAKAGAGRK
jgi:hypothetical protein